MIKSFCVFAAVAGAVAAGPASAAYTITLDAPVTVGTYYEQNGRCEGSGSGCVLSFSHVPAHKILVVRRANCLINSDDIPYSMALGASGLGPTGPLLRPQYFPVSVTSTVQSPTREALAADLTTEMPLTGTPAVEYRVRGNATNTQMFCKISGQLQPQ